jgi:hypothetical protein
MSSVLPPYPSNFDSISSQTTGLPYPGSYGGAYTDHPGSVIPPPGTGIYCSGGKGKRRSSRRKLKGRRKGKGRSKKTSGRSKKTSGTRRKR